MDSLFVRNRFVEPCDVSKKKRDHSSLHDAISRKSKGLLFRLGLRPGWLKNEGASFLNAYDSIMDRCHDHNKRLSFEMACDIEDIITPNGRRMNREQLSSIVMDVRNRLLIAGAGTGKTMTVAGLAEYLFLMRGVDPEKVLFISYTNAAVDEMRSRIRKGTGIDPDVKTFHSLGRRIVSESDGIQPRISGIEPEAFIRGCIENRLSDGMFLKDVIRYLSSHRYADDDRREEYESEHPWITLNGERVKSRGEAEIADNLFAHGIPYRYEAPYAVDTRDSKHGQYKPDFHIEDTNVYIEYFGIDRNNDVPKEWLKRDPEAGRRYLEWMEWKRAVHERNNTVLIPLYSYERFEGTLIESLEASLKANGIEDGECDDRLVFTRLSRGSRPIEHLSRAIASSITLLKSRGYEFPKGRNPKESSRIDALRRVAEPILSEYERTLERNGEMDFHDLLIQSVQRMREGSWSHRYDYVVVDEYQDMSPEKMDMLHGMRGIRDFKLFCVGDDWQSIYRFNGGNVGFILDFEKHWGPSEVMGLCRTYRFSGELMDCSCRFMNRCQLPKHMTGGDSDTPMTILRGSNDFECMRAVSKAVESIPDGDSILFLGRFHQDVVLLRRCGFSWAPKGDHYTIASAKRRDMVYRTIHSSKGTEADHVFVLNNNDAPMGFPDTRAEAPIADIVLDGSGTKMDEERRLFYVAITRARRHLYLVTVNGMESAFLKEMESIMNIRRSDRRK